MLHPTKETLASFRCHALLHCQVTAEDTGHSESLIWDRAVAGELPEMFAVEAKDDAEFRDQLALTQRDVDEVRAEEVRPVRAAIEGAAQ